MHPPALRRLQPPALADRRPLERRYPEEWGRVNRTELSGRAGGPIEIAGEGWDLSKLSSDELGVLQRLLERVEQ